MKCIMSINYKFMQYSPKELILLINNNSKLVEGFEVFVDIHSDFEINYLKELAYQCKKSDFYLQVHGNSNLSIEEQRKFFDMLNDLADYLGYKINVVIHPISASSVKESIEKTIEYVDELIKISDLEKVVISLENLNDIKSEDRLNKDDIIPIVANNENLYFTYDIGHEISNYGIPIIDKNLISIISNIHIHTMDFNYSNGFDHKPILKNDKYWNEILKGLLCLKNNHYCGNVVFEYDLYACFGNCLEEKIISYANSIDYVAERIK